MTRDGIEITMIVTVSPKQEREETWRMVGFAVGVEATMLIMIAKHQVSSARPYFLSIIGISVFYGSCIHREFG